MKETNPEKKDYEYLRESQSNNLTEGEAGKLKLLLKSLIGSHAAYHSVISNLLKETSQGRKGELTVGPTKQFDRTFTKLKQSILENPAIKFPLHKLKDLTRCSMVFEDAEDLLAFFNAFKSDLVQRKYKGLELLEIKNMFKDTSEANKYAYKDVKLILGFRTLSGDLLRVEMQLILKDILYLKKNLHRF